MNFDNANKRASRVIRVLALAIAFSIFGTLSYLTGKINGHLEAKEEAQVTNTLIATMSFQYQCLSQAEYISRSNPLMGMFAMVQCKAESDLLTSKMEANADLIQGPDKITALDQILKETYQAPEGDPLPEAYSMPEVPQEEQALEEGDFI